MRKKYVENLGQTEREMLERMLNVPARKLICAWILLYSNWPVFSHPARLNKGGNL